MKIVFTPSARKQFLNVVTYINKENPAAAAVFRQKSEAALSRLKDFPESGRLLPGFPDLPFREVIIGSYRFFYRVKIGTVWVVAVWRSAQLPDEP